MAETKREFHFWVLPEYEQEEEYLRRMHGRGWALEKVRLPGVYTFRRCQPEDVVYRLDFRPLQGGDREAFLQIYRDYGWEYIQDLNSFSYFRKSADEQAAADLDIFSDNESRLDMVKRILRWRMYPILALLLLIVLPQMILMLSRPSHSGSELAMLGLLLVLFALDMYLVIRCSVGFRRLWRKYASRD